jgi:mono/diheme cytochrome c family protein
VTLLQKYAIGVLLFAILGTTWGITQATVAGDPIAGKQLYQQRCSPCHGSDGKANTPTAQALNPKPRDHTDGAYMNKLSNEHLHKVIKQGGAAVGKSPIMPPQADLSDAQIQDVIAFVRTLAVPPYQGD